MVIAAITPPLDDGAIVMSNGNEARPRKYEHSFTTSLDADAKKRGVKKVTHATILFDVAEGDIDMFAIRAAVVAHQGRMRKHWPEQKDGAKVTLKLSDLRVRLAGVRAITDDDAKAYIRKRMAAATTAEEREAIMKELLA